MTRIARVGFAAVMCLATEAAADGEETPMLGGGVLGAWTRDQTVTVVGAEGEIAWWRGRFGFAIEGSRRSQTDGDLPITVAGASVRLRVHDSLMPSLLEARDVELGVELQGVVEYTWASEPLGREPVGYGLGLALRLRGGSDDDFSRLIAESRLTVRVMTARTDMAVGIARGAEAAPPDHELTLIVGLGAAFGVGNAEYVQRFRSRHFDLLGADH